MKMDYLANQKWFVPTLTRHMYERWRSLLYPMGRSRADFAQFMRDRCRTPCRWHWLLLRRILFLAPLP